SDGGKTWEQPGSGGPAVPAGETGMKPPDPEGTAGPPEMPKGESNKFVYDGAKQPLTTHKFYDNSDKPWEFKRELHLEPSRTDADTVYAGVEDAAIFRTTDGAKTWREMTGLRGHGTASGWSPGAGGLAVHTIVLDEKNPKRMFVAISAAGAFRTDD